LIGQKDNRINLETAAASRRIAEISLRHNTAMKEMAVDSRYIAILTRKDSTDMRIIAVVTLLFLPGTFMATLFSATFFNFLPDDSTQVVSKWIWLYFVLSATATLLVFIAWYLFSKNQNKKMLAGISPESSEPSRPVSHPVAEDHEKSIGRNLPDPAVASLWSTRTKSVGEAEAPSSYLNFQDGFK
jgi:hypothetical protein